MTKALHLLKERAGRSWGIYCAGLTNRRAVFDCTLLCEVGLRQKKKSTGLSFCLNFNKDVVCKVSVRFFSIKLAHNVSPAFTQCYKVLTPTTKNIQNISHKTGCCTAESDIFA